MSANAVQVSEDTVSDQYSGESERVETNGGVAGAGPGSDVTDIVQGTNVFQCILCRIEDQNYKSLDK